MSVARKPLGLLHLPIETGVTWCTVVSCCLCTHFEIDSMTCNWHGTRWACAPRRGLVHLRGRLSEHRQLSLVSRKLCAEIVQELQVGAAAVRSARRGRRVRGDSTSCRCRRRSAQSARAAALLRGGGCLGAPQRRLPGVPARAHSRRPWRRAQAHRVPLPKSSVRNCCTPAIRAAIRPLTRVIKSVAMIGAIVRQVLFRHAARACLLSRVAVKVPC